MASNDVQLQHTQVSAIGEIEPLHVGALFEALARMVHVPPQGFVERETLLHRSDDEAARELEMSDTQWSNVRRARDQVRISVRTQGKTTQFVLPHPPAPPGAAPTVAVRNVVMVEDLTPDVPWEETATEPLPLDPVQIFSISMEDLATKAVHRRGWDEFAYMLNWSPERSWMRYGLRYVLVSQNPLVLHELLVFRKMDWTIDATNRPAELTPSSAIHVRAVSTLRSDVGAGVPKKKQDETARALQYAIQHTQQIQKSLDPIVPLRRDS